MKPNRSLVIAAYLVTLMLFIVPFAELILASLPMRPASVTWRFAAGGNFSRALMTPLLALLLASGIALGLRQRRVLRTVGGVAAALGLWIVLWAIRFLLDLGTMRAGADANASGALNGAAVPVILKMLLGLAIAALLAAGDWQLAGDPESEDERQDAERARASSSGTRRSSAATHATAAGRS